MAIRGLFKRQKPEKNPEPKTQIVHVHDSDRAEAKNTNYGLGRSKHRQITYTDIGPEDSQRVRDAARGVYNRSLLARSIVGRLVDHVINTGLSWEASPIWSLLPRGPQEEEEQRAWTEQIEARWRLYADSTESDARGRMTLHDLQRYVYKRYLIEGEFFAVLRYVDGQEGAGRMSPITIQILGNDQIQDPLDGAEIAAIKERGATLDQGIEFDRLGKIAAIYVVEHEGFTIKKAVRIPMASPDGRRRWVIHVANVADNQQARGFPELSALTYELDQLAEYKISEMEAANGAGLWMGVIKTDKDARTKVNPMNPAGIVRDETSGGGNRSGLQTVEVNGRSLVMNNLNPGQDFSGFQPTRPNAGYVAYVDAVEGEIINAMGCAMSFVREKFSSSYSAGRAETLIQWNKILVDRDAFARNFLSQIYAAWLGEAINAGAVIATDYQTNTTRRAAWLGGTWNGISRPVVDPVKEVQAIEIRQRLAHTTGEREAKAYNGSDIIDNVQRLQTENKKISAANKPLADAENKPEPEQEQEAGNGDED